MSNSIPPKQDVFLCGPHMVMAFIDAQETEILKDITNLPEMIKYKELPDKYVKILLDLKVPSLQSLWQSPTITYINTPSAKAWVVNGYIPDIQQQELFEHLRTTVPFIRHVLYANTKRERRQARLSCSMGGSYPYSGSVHPESSWNDRVYQIMQQVNKDFACNFNSCLVNYYQNGSEYISQHSDDEKGLDKQGQVVSISLGTQRDMTVISKDITKKYTIPLPPGSLFMMEGKDFQKLYTHGINKTSVSVGPRISLTFRCFVVNNTPQQNLSFF
jgi:alkylated DNA repair dioxygenase AlkB